MITKISNSKEQIVFQGKCDPTQCHLVYFKQIGCIDWWDSDGVWNPISPDHFSFLKECFQEIDKELRIDEYKVALRDIPIPGNLIKVDFNALNEFSIGPIQEGG